MDINEVYYLNSAYATGVKVGGGLLGQEIEDADTINQFFFGSILFWDDTIWDLTDIDITNAQVRAQVTQMLLKLPPRMERMLRERFFQGLTLDQIGEKYGISRERIRQIEAKALRMLKHPSRARILRPLLNNSAEIN
jgi:RNA polymerase sigma factor (sigma-70 family)